MSNDAPDAGTPGAATTEAPAELTAPPPGFWSRRSVWQRASLVLLLLAAVISAMMLLLAVGMWRNDMIINSGPIRTTATVLTVSPLSTGIEFVDNHGLSQRPAGGVLYPGGLSVGQQFLVEYAAADPTLVRVAGRSAKNGIIMPGFVLVGTWAVAVPVLWLLRRRDRVEPMDLATALALPPRRRWWQLRRRAR